MVKKIRNDDGSVRVVYNGGRESRVYEKEDSFGFLSDCSEVTTHHTNGTSTSHNYDGSLTGTLAGNKGSKK